MITRFTTAPSEWTALGAFELDHMYLLCSWCPCLESNQVLLVSEPLCLLRGEGDRWEVFCTFPQYGNGASEPLCTGGKRWGEILESNQAWLVSTCGGDHVGREDQGLGSLSRFS